MPVIDVGLIWFLVEGNSLIIIIGKIVELMFSIVDILETIIIFESYVNYSIYRIVNRHFIFSEEYRATLLNLISISY